MFQNPWQVFTYLQTIPGVAQLEHAAAMSVVGWLANQLSGTPLKAITESQLDALVDEAFLALGIPVN